VKADPTAVFDLGSSGRSSVAKDKAATIAEAFLAGHKKPSGSNARRT